MTGRSQDLLDRLPEAFVNRVEASEVAAVLVEPVPGEGGIRLGFCGLSGGPPPDLRRARDRPDLRRGAVGLLPRRTLGGVRALRGRSGPLHLGQVHGRRASHLRRHREGGGHGRRGSGNRGGHLRGQSRGVRRGAGDDPRDGGEGSEPPGRGPGRQDPEALPGDPGAVPRPGRRPGARRHGGGRVRVGRGSLPARGGGGGPDRGGMPAAGAPDPPGGKPRERGPGPEPADPGGRGAGAGDGHPGRGDLPGGGSSPGHLPDPSHRHRDDLGAHRGPPGGGGDPDGKHRRRKGGGGGGGTGAEEGRPGAGWERPLPDPGGRRPGEGGGDVRHQPAHQLRAELHRREALPGGGAPGGGVRGALRRPDVGGADGRSHGGGHRGGAPGAPRPPGRAPRTGHPERGGGGPAPPGGTLPEGPGAYYPPTVLSGVGKGMPAYHEELFGPVAAIIPVKDEEEAVTVANDSPFGPGAAVFTRDVERGERIAAPELEAGTCFVNDFVRSDPRLPFGGVKESGHCRELSEYGIREFVNIKTVYVV